MDCCAVVLGVSLGNYRVLEQLGQGGMGMVYVGRHEQLGHKVVLKVLRPELSRNATIVRRFFNEAQAATAIHNPGIVQVFDFGTTPDGRAYFVMELLEGMTLAQRIARRRLGAVECCRLARQIANVLQSAHEAGITHRDLKPDNLFLVPDTEVVGGERVKVLDFGIAKLAGELHVAGVQTRADAVMGTPSYMSPEQCRGAGAVDTRADIYSLGCVLFKMVCGRAPFVGEGAGDIIGAHLHVPPPDLLDLAPEAPPALAALVARMLKKQPGTRPQTMAAVSQVLDEILRGLAARPAPGAPPLDATDTQPFQRQTTERSAISATTTPTASPPATATESSLAMQETAPVPIQDGPLPGTTTAVEPPPIAGAGTLRLPTPPFTKRLPLTAGQVALRGPTRASLPKRTVTPSGDKQIRGFGRAPTASPMYPVYSRTSATIGGAAGVSNARIRTQWSRYALPIGALTIALSALAIAVAFLLSPNREPGEAAAATKLAGSTAADTAVEPTTTAPPPSSPAIAPPPSSPPAAPPREGRDSPRAAPDPPPAATATVSPQPQPQPQPPPPQQADDLESECNGLMVDRRWSDLAQCANRLAPAAPRRAATLASRAAHELEAAPHVAAAEAALADRDLQRAREELDQIGAEATERRALNVRYAAAAARATAELAERLERAMSPTCAEYQELLTRERTAQPPDILMEATRRVGCTPVRRELCDAADLAEQGRKHHEAGEYVQALWSYEASWYCKVDLQTATRGFVVACNIPNLQKARQFWRRLPAEVRPGAVQLCMNHQITAQQLDAPQSAQ